MPIRQSVKEKWSQFLIGEFTPHEIALGFALGTFVALLPTFGFSVLFVILILFLFPKINKPAALFALAVFNPLVQIPIYTLSYQVGNILYTGMPILKYDIELLNQIYTFTRRFLVGHMIIVISVSLLSYVLVYLFSKKKFTGNDPIK